MKGLAERYIMLDSLLFKLITILEKETALLTIPEMCADKNKLHFIIQVFLWDIKL